MLLEGNTLLDGNYETKKILCLIGNEPRNLRLGHATNGMNPYGNLSNKHSARHLLLVIYNVPLQLCMKCKPYVVYDDFRAKTAKK
ncbi:hypothetical protein L6164_023648 [Bauhinia variegata]|uniref:Uncharacterized protein n=1 Tax=Bauhinia variegata TaxID=167791 RepID=A0ACB9MKY4_BAUVA|nr:hypothetical protein L6164_023648 [Bauhinia variegata]